MSVTDRPTQDVIEHRKITEMVLIYLANAVLQISPGEFKDELWAIASYISSNYSPELKEALLKQIQKARARVELERPDLQWVCEGYDSPLVMSGGLMSAKIAIIGGVYKFLTEDLHPNCTELGD